MQGGVSVAEFDRLYDTPDIDQIKMKNTDFMDDIKIKTNISLNNNKIIKNKNQSADYLIEYFEGMMKNYINLYESRGENVDELKNIFFNNNYKNKFKGGVDIQDLVGYTNETNQNQHPNIQMPLNNNDNRKTIYIKFYRKKDQEYTIRILHAGNCFLHDHYNIIDIIKSIRNSLNNNNNLLNIINNNLMNNINTINCNEINNHIDIDPITDNLFNQIDMINNTIDLNTDLNNIINFHYVLEQINQQFNNILQQINNPQNNQNIPLNILLNYRKFLQQAIQEINYQLNPQNLFNSQDQLNREIKQLNQHINQLNPRTQSVQIQALQDQINKLRNLQILFLNQPITERINKYLKQINVYNPDLYYTHYDNIINHHNNIITNLQTLNMNIHLINSKIYEHYSNINFLNTTINGYLTTRINKDQWEILDVTNFDNFNNYDKLIINNYRKINNLLQAIININPLDYQLIQQIKYQINILDNQINMYIYKIKVYKQHIQNINQGINQLNSHTQSVQIQNFQKRVRDFRLLILKYNNHINQDINLQIIQRKKLIVQLNQLLNQCYLNFIKYIVKEFNKRFNNMGINPIINYNININNIYDLEIDLHNNYIVDHCNKIYSNDISNIDTQERYITDLLKKVIERLIDYNYNLYTNGICVETYTDNHNQPSLVIENTIKLYKGIISLLIMILTIRHDMGKDIYKKYNSSFLLAATCKYLLSKHISVDNYEDIFSGNNVNLLTYVEDKTNNIIKYEGDCALNVLMCIKYRDLRNLLVQKINYSEISLNEYLNLNELQQLHNNYYNQINDVLNNIPVYDDCNFKNSIIEFVDEYYKFVEYIIDKRDCITNCANNIKQRNNINANNDSLKNFIINKQKFDSNTPLPNIDYQELYRWYQIFYSVIRNNLLDYRIDANTLDKILNLRNIIFNSIDINTNNDVDKICNNKNKLILLMDNILSTSGKSFIIFEINLLISLLLIQYKIDYLFDDDIMNVLRHSNNKANILKCFRNIGDFRNELEYIFPHCHEENNDSKYLFINTCPDNIAHAVLTIFRIKRINGNINKKVYIYDINDLILYGSEDYNQANNMNNVTQETETRTFVKYKLANNNPIWPSIHGFSDIHWREEKRIQFRNLAFITIYWSGRKLTSAIPIDNILCGIYYNADNQLDIDALLNLPINIYTEDTFNIQAYKKIKEQIFGNLCDHCRRYINISNKKNYDLLNKIQFIYINLKIEIINNQKCSIRKLLFKFIECLIKAKIANNVYNIDGYNNALNNEYNYVLNDNNNIFINTYYLNKNNFTRYLNYNNNINCYGFGLRNGFNINKDIEDVLDILCYKSEQYDFNGGNYVFDSNINTKCNNSIIKKVLIILLIILIIIIIVLIVLYVINKYKNNDDYE